MDKVSEGDSNSLSWTHWVFIPKASVGVRGNNKLQGQSHFRGGGTFLSAQSLANVLADIIFTTNVNPH